MINDENPFLPNRWQMHIGIMTESTAFKNQRWFHVFVPEFMPNTSGDVTGGSKSESSQLGNIWNGKPEKIDPGFGNQINPVNDGGNVNVTKTIYADYMGIDNGMDVPTVYRNMQVMVINYANTDKWYWLPLERDRSYKTFEHVRLSALDVAVTNKNAEAAKDNIGLRNREIKDENTYYLEIDTKYHKRIILSTANSDGEPWRYFIEMNSQTNALELWDVCSDGSQPNNLIKIESRPSPEIKGRILLQNASGTSFVLDGENMAINVPRNLTLSVGADFIFNVVGNRSMTVGTPAMPTTNTEQIFGTNSTTTEGIANHIYKQDLVENVSRNKTVTVVGQHTEKQASRMTLCELSTLVATKAHSISAGALNMEIKNIIAKVQILTLDISMFNLTAAICNMTFGKHIMAVLATMSYVLPFHVSVPETPAPTHTTFS